MGRGRAKAKQTKVARELKYFSPEHRPDARLSENCTGPPYAEPERASDSPTDEDEYDEYGKWASGQR